MSRLSFVLACSLIVLPGLCEAETFDDYQEFYDFLGGDLTTLVFEGVVPPDDPDGTVQLAGNEFEGLQFSGDPDLFVRIPDIQLRGLGGVPVSENALLGTFPGTQQPVCGVVTIDFESPVLGVGVYFIDVEYSGSYLEAFDDLGATGNSVGRIEVPGPDLPPPLANGAHDFRGIAGDNIRSAVLSLGMGLCDGVLADNLSWKESVKSVQIDIKPGSDPNCFNINGHGVIPVSILGSADFDASQVNPGSLTFDGLAVRVRGKRGPLCSEEDSNGDGYMDRVCHFEDDAEYWVGGGDTATVSGMLFDGTEFEGSDSICVVP